MEIKKENNGKEKYIITDNKPVSRNDGLICISQNGMKENRYWEETRVEIDLKTREVDFMALVTILADSYESERVYYPEWKSQNDLPILAPDPEDPISFDEWGTFAENVLKLIKEGVYVANSKSGELVYNFIE